MQGHALRRIIRRTTSIALLLISVASTLSFAQDTATFNVPVSGENRLVLAQAESLISDQQAERAFRLLAPLEAELAGNPYFDYLLGVAALDSGRLGDAIFSLQRSITVAPRYAGARMELARAYYEAGDRAQARPLFVSLLDENPPPGVRDVLQQYIDAIDERPATPGSRFSPWLEVHTGHDSNANGSTGNQQFLGFMLNPQNLETESPFAEIGAGFTWVVPQSSRLAWLSNARLGHRDNPDASFVDSTTLSGFAGAAWQRADWFGRAGMDGYWAARDGNSNENYAGIDLLFGNRIAEAWDVTFGLRGGAQRFDSSLQVLEVDRFLYTLGVSHRFAATSRLGLQLIGGSDNEVQSGSPYGNSKAGGRLSLDTGLGDNAFLHASLGRLTSDYDGLFFGLPREDRQTSVSFQLEFRNVFTDGLSLMPGFRYVDNKSDVSLYQYDRMEIGLLIRWTPQ